MKAAAAVVIFVLLTAPAMGCEMCRDATQVRVSTDLPITATAAPQPVTAGLAFNNSIYFMLASLGVAGGLVVRTVKRAIRQQTCQCNRE